MRHDGAESATTQKSDLSTEEMPMLCIIPFFAADVDAGSAANASEKESAWHAECKAVDAEAGIDGFCGPDCKCCRPPVSSHLPFAQDVSKQSGSSRLSVLKEWAILLGLGGAFIGATLVTGFHLMCCVFHRKYQRGRIFAKYYDPAWRHTSKDDIKDAWNFSDSMESGQIHPEGNCDRAPQPPGSFAFEKPPNLFIDISPRQDKDGSNLPNWADWSGTFRSSWSEISTQASTPTGPSPVFIGRQASRTSFSSTDSGASFDPGAWTPTDGSDFMGSRRDSGDSSSSFFSPTSSPTKKSMDGQEDSAQRSSKKSSRRGSKDDSPQRSSHQKSKESHEDETRRSSKSSPPEESSRKGSKESPTQSRKDFGATWSAGDGSSSSAKKSSRSSQPYSSSGDHEKYRTAADNESPNAESKKHRKSSDTGSEKFQTEGEHKQRRSKSTEGGAEKPHSESEHKQRRSKSTEGGVNEPEGPNVERKKSQSESEHKQRRSKSTDGGVNEPEGPNVEHKKRNSNSSTKEEKRSSKSNSDKSSSKEDKRASASEERPSGKSMSSDSSDLGGAVAQTIALHKKSIDFEVNASMSKPLEWRKRHFRQLLLSWHPDKNRGDAKRALVATGVFQHIQSRKERYLGDET